MVLGKQLVFIVLFSFMGMVFIDVHAHLDMCNGSVKEIIKKSQEAGVGVIINSGISPERNRKTLEIAKNFPENVKAALGIYPVEASEMNEKQFDAEVDFIRKNADKIVAIGEIGMDFKELDKRELQETRFKELIKLSLELGKPMIIHSRKAEQECVQILEEMKAKRVLMHCFSGKLSLVEKIVKNGWFLSIPSSVKYLLHFQEIIKAVPIEQLLCETDSPFLHPDKKRDNEPVNVIASYEMIAKIKEISLNEAKVKIEENFKKLFAGI